MGFLKFFTLFVIQLTGTLATQPIPLKCLIQDFLSLGIFPGSPDVATPHVVNSLRSEPLNADSIKFDQDGWQHEATNVDYQGLQDAILDDFGFNMTSKVSRLTFHTDMVVSYNYKTTGVLFDQPINGEGQAVVTLKNIQFVMVMPFDIIEVNGNKFIKLINVDFSYDVKDNAEFNFGNLYNGDKALSDSMHNLINKNWKYVSEFGRNFMDKVAGRIFDGFKNHLLATPLRDFNTC